MGWSGRNIPSTNPTLYAGAGSRKGWMRYRRVVEAGEVDDSPMKKLGSVKQITTISFDSDTWLLTAPYSPLSCSRTLKTMPALIAVYNALTPMSFVMEYPTDNASPNAPTANNASNRGMTIKEASKASPAMMNSCTLTLSPQFSNASTFSTSKCHAYPGYRK